MAVEEFRVREDDQPPGASLWRHWGFLLLWGGQTASEMGAQVTVVALPLVGLLVLHGGTAQVASLAAAQTAAQLLVALPAGALVGRVDPRRLMAWCDIARVGLIGSVPVAGTWGVLTWGQLYAVAFTAGVLDVVFSVAYFSYVPTLISPGQLMDGNGKLRVSQSAAEVAGPSLGAALVGAVGAAAAMAADAASYVVSAVCLAAIRTPPARPAAGAKAPPTRMRGGLAYLLGDPIMRAGVRCVAASNFCVAMAEALGPVFLVRTLGLAPGYVGALVATGAVGGVAGGLLAGRLALRVGSARLTWMSMGLLALPGLLIPLAAPGPRVGLFAAGWAFWAFSATVGGVGLLTYRQATCPPGLLPQVNAAVRTFCGGALPLGYMAGGLLGAAVGVRAALWVAVVGKVAAGVWFYASPLRTLRDLPGTPTPQVT